MKKDGVTKVKNVWKLKNNILNPTNSTIPIEIINQIASLFSAGPYYYFIFNFENYKMDFVHRGIEKVLGLKSTDFSIEKLFELMHPEDLDKMHEKELKATDFLFNQIPREDLPLYKVVYLMRLRHKNGSYRTILHQSKTIVVSGNGKIQQVMGVHTDVTFLNIPFDHKVSFISQNRPSYFCMETDSTFNLIDNSFKNSLTQREKEIIQKISEGKDFKEIARVLSLSPHTINTHKKNILKKSRCKNTAELITKCIREGVI